MSVGKIVARTGVCALLAALVLGTGTDAAKGADEPIEVKVALLLPRTPELAVAAGKINQRLNELTNNGVKVRIYWGGAAGDDKNVLRKMRTGQIDGAPLPLEIVSNFVRQALVLQSPALFTNYKQVDAVRAALTPVMDKEAYENGFKVMAWGDIGRLRIMSTKPLSRIADFKTLRPWLYPESDTLKEFYKIIGATGVPLDIAEVYSSLQTNMIDTVWGSALLAAALQWHTATKYISEQGLGFISGAFVFRRGLWEGLPENIKSAMVTIADEARQKNQIELRKSDERAYLKLVERGHKPLRPAKEQEWWDTGHALRQRMIGRVYTKELVEQAEQIAAKYKD